MDPAMFRNVMSHIPTPVVAVTAVGPDGPVGMAVGSFFSLSLDPPLIGWCPAKTSATWPSILASGRFGVNVFADDQSVLCQRFASAGSDRFDSLAWSPGTNGAPRLDGAVVWIECAIDAVHDAGDHVICVGRVLDLEADPRTGPLAFYQRSYVAIASPVG